MDERKAERVEVDGMELRVEPVDESEDRQDEGPREVHTALPPRVESWRRRSVAGAVLSGFAFGLREALEPEREETAIIVQVSGEPVADLPVEADLNERQPSESVVTVRPWLLSEPADPVAEAGDQAAGAADHAEKKPFAGQPEDGSGPHDESGSAGSSPDR